MSIYHGFEQADVLFRGRACARSSRSDVKAERSHEGVLRLSFTAAGVKTTRRVQGRAEVLPPAPQLPW